MCSLGRLPPQSLIEVFSFLTHDSRCLKLFGAICSDVQATLATDAAWNHLCVKYWYATEERLKDWPKLSSRGLYRALEQWVPLEGFYVLTPLYPFGLLVLVRITQGTLSADVIRFVASPGSNQFEEVTVPLLRIQLTEEPTGSLQSTVDAAWLGAQSALVSSVKPVELCAHTEIAMHFGSQHFVADGLFGARRALRIAACEEPKKKTEAKKEERAETEYGEEGEEGNEEDDEAVPMLRMANLGNLFTTAEVASSKTNEMIDSLLKNTKIPCDLALLRSPDDFVPLDASCPHLRPGLYVGDYGHDFYGQFRTEVLLLEHVVLTHAELAAEVEHPTGLFHRPRGEPAPNELQALLTLGQGATFMRGVKQCGDFHVPMGATTFVAVGGPSEACSALAAGHKAPQAVLNRATGSMEEVLVAWRGFGTLAAPGFRNPSWAGGWLVRLMDGDIAGDHRFGFVWDRNQDAVVLRWINLQDSNPFLQRAWLPEDVQ